MEELLGDELDDLVLESSIGEGEKKVKVKSEVPDETIIMVNEPSTSKENELTNSFEVKDHKPKATLSANGHNVKPDLDESLSAKKTSTPSRKRTASKTPDDSSKIFHIFSLNTKFKNNYSFQ